MKNVELKAKIKANSAKGMKKPELFALLHEVLSPEALERFSGYVRYLENKFGTTDLIYRFTGGVGASVRFYIRTNISTASGATAISFDVKDDTWVMPENLPYRERDVSHDEMYVRDNHEALKLKLQSYAKAAGRFLEVERVLNKAVAEAGGAREFVVYEEGTKLYIKCLGGTKEVLINLTLNQRRQIAADVHEHAIVSWTNPVSDHADQAANSAALADMDFKERMAAWRQEDKESNDRCKAYAEEHYCARPSSERALSVGAFARNTPETVLSYIREVPNDPQAVANLMGTFEKLDEELFASGGIERWAFVIADKSPWLGLVIGSHANLAIINLFFKDDVFVDHLVVATRPRRPLEEFFSPSHPTLNAMGAGGVLFLLAFNSRDNNTYDKAAAHFTELHDRGCKAFLASYAADEEGNAVVTIGPDYTQYNEMAKDHALSFTYDGLLKLIETDLVEEPAQAEPTRGTFAGLAAMHSRPSQLSGLDGRMLNRPIRLIDLCAMIPSMSKPGASTTIISALMGRVGNRETVSLHLVDPLVLEIRCLDQDNQSMVALRVRVDQNDFQLIEPIRPYGLPLGDKPTPAYQAEGEFHHSMLCADAINYVMAHALSQEHATVILDALERRAPEADGFTFKWDEAIGRVNVSAFYGTVHDNSSTRVATIGLVGEHLADIDQSSAQLDELLRKRGGRPSRFSDRPEPSRDNGLHMPSPDQEHVREVMEAPTPEAFVFPRETQASVDKADADTALNFLKLVTSGMPHWKILQAMEFVATVANNIRSERPLMFRVVANNTIFIQYGELVEDVMTSVSSIKIPRD